MITENNIVYGGDDEQPTVCPKCGSRTDFVELVGLRQGHVCLGCGFEFIYEFEPEKLSIGSYLDQLLTYVGPDLSAFDFESADDETKAYVLGIKQAVSSLRVYLDNNIELYDLYLNGD